MKFHLFHLMPWPDLPDTFTEDYRSVWIDAPARTLFDPARGHQLYNDYLDTLEAGEELGFDSIGVNEHHSNAYGMMPSPNLMAAAIARRTSRAKILVLGDSVALYNPPIRVAEELAMLDVISGGRIVAGFPTGTPMDTVFAYGQNPATIRDRYREAVSLILKAWTAEETFTWNGRFTKLRYVNVWPRPLQTPHPPVWVPGSGSVETWDYCLDNDFLYAYLSFWGYQRSRGIMEGFWEAAARHGAEPNPYRTAFVQFVGVAENDAEAERLYAAHAEYFYNRCLHVYPGYLDPPGYTTAATMRRGVQRSLSGERREPQEHTWKQIVDQGMVVAGSPATVAERLEEVVKGLRFGHLIVQCHMGSMPKETALYNLTRFAQEVMPRLRGQFGEWEDRWWPRQEAGLVADEQ